MSLPRDPALESSTTWSNQFAPSAELSTSMLLLDVVRENWRNEYTNT
jgi:hypothetical protein